MTMLESPALPVRPANQTRRIAIMRLLFVAALPLILLTHPRWPTGPAALLHLAGTICILAAVLGRFWATIYIGGRKNGQLLRDGPYSICRHPLYLFSIIGIAGFGLLLESLTLAALFGAAGWLVLALIVRREERFLRSRFGADHMAYCNGTPMLWPRPSAFRTAPEVTMQPHLLWRNGRDALVFLAALPLAQAIDLAHRGGHLAVLALW